MATGSGAAASVGYAGESAPPAAGRCLLPDAALHHHEVSDTLGRARVGEQCQRCSLPLREQDRRTASCDWACSHVPDDQSRLRTSSSVASGAYESWYRAARSIADPLGREAKVGVLARRP